MFITPLLFLDAVSLNVNPISTTDDRAYGMMVRTLEVKLSLWLTGRVYVPSSQKVPMCNIPVYRIMPPNVHTPAIRNSVYMYM